MRPSAIPNHDANGAIYMRTVPLQAKMSLDKSMLVVAFCVI